MQKKKPWQIGEQLAGLCINTIGLCFFQIEIEIKKTGIFVAVVIFRGRAEACTPWKKSRGPREK